MTTTVTLSMVPRRTASPSAASAAAVAAATVGQPR